jgi:hypothetical protein
MADKKISQNKFWLEQNADEPDTVIYEATDDAILTHRYQDVENLLKKNKEERNSFDGYNKARDMKRVASIPLVVLYQWLQDDGVFLFNMTAQEQHEYLKKKLNDPKYYYLRTSEGKI